MASNKNPRVNHQIRASRVRLIDPDGEQIGVMDVEDARAQAEAENLDLVEVAPKADPPVCRIMDYGKYKYQQQKRARDKRSGRVELKQVKLRPNTDDHDLMTKLRHARKFLENRNKVKITVNFKGREITHPEIARELLERSAEELEDVGEISSPPRMEGRSMVMFLQPT
jgi:translation initiation factor IF-3